jgi:hypothetical protein
MIKRRSSFFSIALVAMVGVACSYLPGPGGEFRSASDKFSIAFPGGPADVKTESKAAKYAMTGNTYSKMFDNRSDNYRSYEVQSMMIAPSTVTGKDLKQILEIGLNGWEDEPGTVVNDIVVNGQKGLDSVRTMEVGPAKMTFREVVFWSDKDKRLYVIQIAATKKEDVAAKEANDFVNSFKLIDG